MDFMRANEIFQCTGTREVFHLGQAMMSIDFSVWNEIAQGSFALRDKKNQQ